MMLAFLKPPTLPVWDPRTKAALNNRHQLSRGWQLYCNPIPVLKPNPTGTSSLGRVSAIGSAPAAHLQQAKNGEVHQRASDLDAAGVETRANKHTSHPTPTSAALPTLPMSQTPSLQQAHAQMQNTSEQGPHKEPLAAQ